RTSTLFPYTTLFRSVRGHERGDRRDHRLGLGLVAFERLDHQREPGCVGEQPDRDLQLQPTFLREPGFTEPVTAVGLEVQGGDVVDRKSTRLNSSHVK